MAIACNCIGYIFLCTVFAAVNIPCIRVNFMLMAIPDTDAGSLAAGKDPETKLDAIRSAIQYHERHLSVADQGGSFVANTNLGICYGILGNFAQSGQHHQEALRVAIKMQTLYGQSISVGNLGLLALSKGDNQTARTCLEQVEREAYMFNDLIEQDMSCSICNWFKHSKMLKQKSMHGSWYSSVNLCMYKCITDTTLCCSWPSLPQHKATTMQSWNIWSMLGV